MRRWFEENLGPVLYVCLGVLTIVLIAILTWGIGARNLTAAMISGGGLAVVIVIGGSLLLVPDNMRSQETERILRLASVTLVHMRAGLTPISCRAVCQLLLPETQAAAIAMTDTTHTLAYVGEKVSLYGTGTYNSVPTREVLESKRIQTFSGLDRLEWIEVVDIDQDNEASSRVQAYPAAIFVPLVVLDQAVGVLKLYYRRGAEVDRTQMAIARGLADLLSTQLTVSELDRQAEMTARAEIKALQAQINPHFLFNTLNTIASFTRTDPTKARDLLREFSVFYRRTLENSQEMVPLSAEIDQTQRYLRIEKARFGEDRIVESVRIEEGCGDILVPGFIVQPIVENAVRHAMSEEGPLHIDVQVATDGNDVLVAVADDGLGMDEQVAQRLLEEPSQQTRSASQGTGIALRNVAERIELFYGKGSGVEVISRPGEGTCVTLRLADVAPYADDDLDDDFDDENLV